jgi:tetratricopeptide (TPR) repeat protein
MNVSRVCVEQEGDRVVLSALVEPPGRTEAFPLRYAFSKDWQGSLSCTADYLIPALLPICMRIGETLRIDGTVSRDLLRRVGAIERAYVRLDPSLSAIRVRARRTVRSVRRSGTSAHLGSDALFFSLGLDSRYSFFRHRGEIGTLIMMNGFDAWMWTGNEQARIVGALGSFIQTHGAGVRAAVVETNLRTLTDEYVDWIHLQFGGALVSVAYALRDVVNKAFIASSYTPKYQPVQGSHPQLDPLWSTRNLEIVHDGAEFSRTQKARFLAHIPGSLTGLRVCERFNREQLNCGLCSKCLRTMLNLHLGQALEACATLPHDISLARIRTLDIRNQEIEGKILELLGEAEALGADEALKEALREALSREEALRSVRLGEEEAIRIRCAARARVEEGKHEEAIQELTVLLNGRPLDSDPYYLMGFCLQVTGRDLEEAIQLYGRALELGHDEFWVRYNRGALYMRLGRIEEARADLARAVELDPKHDGARATLDALLTNKG